MNPEQLQTPDEASNQPAAAVPEGSEPQAVPSVESNPGSAAEPAVIAPASEASSEATTPNIAPAPAAAAQPADQPTAAADAPEVQPAATDTPVVVSSGGGDGATPPPNAPPSDKRRRWLLPAIVAVLIVLGAGGYVFGMYLPNRPGTVYSTGLTNTGKALDKLVSYANQQTGKHYSSYNFSGTLKVTSGVSIDATIKGAFDKHANGTLNLAADAMGQKFTINLRSVHAAGNDTPDVYLQLGGIKPLLDNYGLNSLDSLEGEWISVDHTLLSSVTADGAQSLGADHLGSLKQAPTSQQITDADTKVQTVNKQYLFTTDPSKAVLTSQQYLGKETKNGRTAYHYSVGYDKAHLSAYVGALKTALDSSTLNNWAKQASGGNDLSKTLDFANLQQSVQGAKAGYRFDMWVDAKTKLVQSLRFTDPADKNSVFTIAQNYTGGTNYPFSLTFSGKSGSGAPTSSVFNLALDTASNTVSVQATGKEDTTNLSLNFKVTPSTSAVKVAAPAGATPVMDVLNQLGLGGDTSGSLLGGL